MAAYFRISSIRRGSHSFMASTLSRSLEDFFFEFCGFGSNVGRLRENLKIKFAAIFSKKLEYFRMYAYSSAAAANRTICVSVSVGFKGMLLFLVPVDMAAVILVEIPDILPMFEKWVLLLQLPVDVDVVFTTLPDIDDGL